VSETFLTNPASADWRRLPMHVEQDMRIKVEGDANRGMAQDSDGIFGVESVFPLPKIPR